MTKNITFEELLKKEDKFFISYVIDKLNKNIILYDEKTLKDFLNKNLSNLKLLIINDINIDINQLKDILKNKYDL